MSFGGSVSSMITSLKNNARSKRKTYFDRDNTSSKNQKKEKNALLDKKASPELLAKIKKEIIEENKRVLIKNLVITILSILTLILIIALIRFYYLDSIKEFLA